LCDSHRFKDRRSDIKRLFFERDFFIKIGKIGKLVVSSLEKKLQHAGDFS
jgi:hypothetical protein